MRKEYGCPGVRLSYSCWSQLPSGAELPTYIKSVNRLNMLPSDWVLRLPCPELEVRASLQAAVPPLERITCPPKLGSTTLVRLTVWLPGSKWVKGTPLTL